MGVRTALQRFAAGVPHVLIAEAPGGTGARLAIEELVRVRGWPVVASPADADVLVITGPECSELAGFVDRVWQQIPRPRVRVPVPVAADAVAALDRARALLAQGGQPAPSSDRSCSSGDGGDDHHEHGAGREHADGGSAGSSHEHASGHEHHHGSAADMPGGLAMADRGPDRDGLMLDQLHVPFGPVLPDWPAGLVLHTTLQGDVVQDARVAVVSGNGPVGGFWNEPWRRTGAGVTVGEAARWRVGAHLDSLARLLAVAGWPDVVFEARRIRDEVLAGADIERVVPELGPLARRLRGSRTLRWLTADLGVLSPAVAEQAGVTGPAWRASRSAGDVRARWWTWLDEVDDLVRRVDDIAPLPEGVEPPRGEAGSAPLLAVIPGLLLGTELATARLIVASLDPDPAELAQTPQGVFGG